MGIFMQRGIEYLIIVQGVSSQDRHCLTDDVFTNHKIKLLYLDSFDAIVVVNQTFSDELLVRTKYFLDNKDIWFNDTSDFIKKVELEDLQIPTHISELIAFTKGHEKLKNKIKDYGWYDVNRISTTY